jgi:hypothetical protein
MPLLLMRDIFYLVNLRFYSWGKKEPPIKSGGPNQKPLTIKPYPMKIQG